MTLRQEFNQVARIRVFGVGGGGCNAVNRMVSAGVKGVDFFVCNTDLQALKYSPCPNKLILGKDLTKGLGAGGNPEVGRKAAIESTNDLKACIRGSDMVFIACGMGGGTGTGAAPVIAKLAKESGALTVGIVTRPFDFEGRRRNQQAIEGLNEIKQYVDSLIVVSNNQLLNVIGKVPMVEAFAQADNILKQGVQTITDLIAVPALINLDFADVRATMTNKGTALFGVGMSRGENKARDAATKAINSPLLEANIKGAKSAIVNVTGGRNVSLLDSKEAIGAIREAAGNDVDIIYGVAVNEELEDSVIVTVIATGFDADPQIIHIAQKTPEQVPEKNKAIIMEDEQIPTFFKNRI